MLVEFSGLTSIALCVLSFSFKYEYFKWQKYWPNKLGIGVGEQYSFCLRCRPSVSEAASWVTGSQHRRLLVLISARKYDLDFRGCPSSGTLAWARGGEQLNLRQQRKLLNDMEKQVRVAKDGKALSTFLSLIRWRAPSSSISILWRSVSAKYNSREGSASPQIKSSGFMDWGRFRDFTVDKSQSQVKIYKQY